MESLQKISAPLADQLDFFFIGTQKENDYDRRHNPYLLCNSYNEKTIDYTMLANLLSTFQNLKKCSIPIYDWYTCFGFEHLLSVLPASLQYLKLRKISNPLSLTEEIHPSYIQLKAFISEAPFQLSESTCLYLGKFTQLQLLRLNICSGLWGKLAIFKGDVEATVRPMFTFLSKYEELKDLGITSHKIDVLPTIPTIYFDQIAAYSMASTLTTLHLDRVILAGVTKESAQKFTALRILGLNFNGPQTVALAEFLLPQVEKLILYSKITSSLAGIIGEKGGHNLATVDMKKCEATDMDDWIGPHAGFWAKKQKVTTLFLI